METLWLLTVVILGLSLDTCQVQAGCSTSMDIAILIDTSKSMDTKERKKLCELVYTLIDTLGVSPDGSHYGVITFDRYSKVHNLFSNPMYQSKVALKSMIGEKIQHQPGKKDWGTRSDLALHQAATQLFTEEGGDRPDAKNLMVIFTDGKQFIKKSDVEKLPFIDFAKSTKALEDKGVHITAVGILGKGWNDKYKRFALQEMAGDKGETIMHETFDDLTNNFPGVLAALCDCAKKLDIALLIDTSKSMDTKQRNKLRELVFKIIDVEDVSPDAVHFSVITFDLISTVHNLLKSQEYQSKEALKDMVSEKIMHDPGPKAWGTRTDIALMQAAKQVFTEEGGDRPDAKNIAFVLTDGKPFIEKGDTKPFIDFAISTKELEDKDVSITVIGIFADKSDETRRKMEETAGAKGKVILHQNFDEVLNHFEETLASLCPEADEHIEQLCNGQKCDDKKRTISSNTNPDVYDTDPDADDTYPDEYYMDPDADDTFPDVYDTESDFFDYIEEEEPIDPEMRDWIV